MRSRVSVQQSVEYLTDGLLQVVSPDVDVVQGCVNLHSLSQRQQSLRPDVVTADRQPDGQTETAFVCLMEIFLAAPVKSDNR